MPDYEYEPDALEEGVPCGVDDYDDSRDFDTPTNTFEGY